MVRRTATPSNLADTRPLSIFRISVTFNSCVLPHPQPHESNLTRAALEKGEGGGGIILDVEPMSMPAKIQRLQRQTWITMRDALAHLKVHPTHGSKHIAVRTMHLSSFHLKTLRNRSLLGAIPRKASYMTMKPASCDTTLGGRCCSWTPYEGIHEGSQTLKP